MMLNDAELQAIAEALAPKVADLLAAQFERQPEWAFSVAEAASWAKIEEHVVRDAIADGRLPAIRLGRQVRIKRADLFLVRNGKPL